MGVYRIPVTLYATAYVRAASEQEALRIANERLPNSFIDAEGDDFSSLTFDDPDLPDVSLSPAMTVSEGELTEVEQADD